MKLKTKKYSYYSGIFLLALGFGTSGFLELTKNPKVWDGTIQLGYPPHFIYLLGFAKLCGVVVLLVPNKLHRLKEWVFAGFFFDVFFAFVSKTTILGVASTIDTVIAFITLIVTYIFFRELYPTTYKNVLGE